MVLGYAMESIRGDRDFVLSAAQDIGAEVLVHAAEVLRADREFVLEVADYCTPGDMLQHATEAVRAELLGDREFVREAMQEVGPEVLEHASQELRGDRSFMLDLSDTCPGGLVLEYATDACAQSCTRAGNLS